MRLPLLLAALCALHSAFAFSLEEVDPEAPYPRPVIKSCGRCEGCKGLYFRTHTALDVDERRAARNGFYSYANVSSTYCCARACIAESEYCSAALFDPESRSCRFIYGPKICHDLPPAAPVAFDQYAPVKTFIECVKCHGFGFELPSKEECAYVPQEEITTLLPIEMETGSGDTDRPAISTTTQATKSTTEEGSGWSGETDMVEDEDEVEPVGVGPPKPIGPPGTLPELSSSTKEPQPPANLPPAPAPVSTTELPTSTAEITTPEPTTTEPTTTVEPTTEEPKAARPQHYWVKLGCYSKEKGGEPMGWVKYELTHEGLSTSPDLPVPNMTNDKCRAICQNATKGYDLAGTLNGDVCFCGKASEILESKLVPESKCFVPCEGNKDDVCGGDEAFTVYINYAYPAHSHIGCFKDDSYPLLPHAALPGDSEITNEKCTDACFKMGFSAAGTKGGKSCFCGSASALADAVQLDEGDCAAQCRGDDAQACGGPTALTAFQLYGYQATHSFEGCYNEERHNINDYTMLPKRMFNNGNAAMSHQYCISQCERRGFEISGLPWDSMCLCGSQRNLDLYSFARTSESECSMKCYGKMDEACGAKLITRALKSDGVSAPVSRDRYRTLLSSRPAKGKAGEEVGRVLGALVEDCRAECLTDSRCWSVAAEPRAEGGYSCHLYAGVDLLPLDAPNWQYILAEL